MFFTCHFDNCKYVVSCSILALMPAMGLSSETAPVIIRDIFPFVNKKTAFNLANWRNYPIHQFQCNPIIMPRLHLPYDEYTMPVRCPNHRFRAASAGRHCDRRTDLRASWPLRFCLRSGYLQSTVNSQKTLKWLCTVNCQ